MVHILTAALWYLEFISDPGVSEHRGPPRTCSGEQVGCSPAARLPAPSMLPASCGAWSQCLTSLNFSILLCKAGMITVSTSEGKLEHVHRAHQNR